MRPSLDDLMKLELNPGINEISYVLTSKVHGEQKLTAYIYLLDINKPIVDC